VVTKELDVFLSGVEAEGSDIPAVVLVEKSTPQAQEVAEGAPVPMEEVAEEAAAAARGEEATVPPEVALEVAVSSPGDPGRGAHPLYADDGSCHE
jgi:hypothetical protein